MILILLLNVTLVRDRINFNPPVTVLDCLTAGDAYREAVSTYHGPGKDQGWYLNDGRGTIQGIYCE